MERTTAADFFRDRPRPAQTQTRPQPTPAPAAPRINVPDVSRALEDALRDSTVSRASESDQRALLNYINRLRAQIELAWDKPTSVTGQDEWVEVIVTVEANGRISGHRISRHQASASFQRTVEAAIRNTRPIGPPPDGIRREIKYTLRVREG